MNSSPPPGAQPTHLRLQALIDSAQRIVFFGGAGVSTESGIPDFRSADGLYSGAATIPPEVILSRSFFQARPADFFEFYRDKVLHPEAAPNPAHLKLAELERAGRLDAVVTQNIDGLHQAAGSNNVLELHGSVHRNHCRNCGHDFSLADVYAADGVPRCGCGGIVEPDVVLYEDPLDSSVLNEAVRRIAAADLLIVGGTSLVVYPAASLVDYFQGDHVVVINKGGAGPMRHATLVITEPIGVVLGAIAARPIAPAAPRKPPADA